MSVNAAGATRADKSLTIFIDKDDKVCGLLPKRIDEVKSKGSFGSLK